MTFINSMGELKEFVGKKHLHFCKKCWSKFVCGVRDRKDCPLPDGVFCDNCTTENNRQANRKRAA